MNKVVLLLREIYDKLCPECKEKVAELVSQKISKEQIKQALESGTKEGADES